MPKITRVRSILYVIVVPLFFLFVLLLAVTSASARPLTGDLSSLGVGPDADGLSAFEPAIQADVAPTLTVAILSSRYGILDNTDPAGLTGLTPRVYVVEAMVTNDSDVVAEAVVVDLDYNEDPVTGWVLQGNEVPERSHDQLAPGESYYAYWFASYPVTPGLTHQYTVTAQAIGFDPVSTSENYYGPPENGGTVQTKTYLSTGNSGIVQVDARIVVGVAYTVAVDYKLSNNPKNIVFSPAGNADFEPSTTRLLSSTVRFHDEANTQSLIVHDRLYFPEIPRLPDNSIPEMAEAVYYLLPLTPGDMRLCAYAGVGFNTRNKYDTHFCNADKGTIISVEGTVSFTMTKTVDSQLVEQGELLNYTLDYSNDGTLPLGAVWVWDEIDPAIGRIVASTIDPLPDVNESTDTLVAWNIGELPPVGSTGSSGTFTVTVLVDGAGTDLINGQTVINNGYFGIDPGSLPQEPALTSTVTSVVQAPVVTISKSDGLETIGNGEPLVYTVTITNDGPVSATNIVITDVLPSGVNYDGGASGSPDYDGDLTLTWPLGTYLDLGPGGDVITLTIPVSSDFGLATFTVLTNTAYVSYGNPAGFLYQPAQAIDLTTVNRNRGFVEGYAFVDENGDGIFDAAESGLAGVTITLSEALTPTTTTGNDGYYRFWVEVPEWVWVEAGLRAGYFRTTPAAIPLQNVFDLTQRVDFGYALTEGAQFGVIFGLVYGDANHNGQLDGGEAGLPGVSISSAEAATTPVLTREQGQYSLRINESGTVTVTETNPAGYVSTTPDVVQVEALLGSQGGSPVDFGDFMGIKVQGKVFEDLDVDGLDDPDPGLAGATVSAGPETFITLADGLYMLYVPLEGSGPIDVTEEDPAGYISTNALPGTEMSKVDANTLRIDTPVSGTVYAGNKFGDAPATGVVTISGQVWNDNGQGGGNVANGLPDGSEPGLSGAVVSLSSGMSQTTAADGFFVLYAPVQTEITVTETNPADFVSTNALPGNNGAKVDNDTLVIEALAAGITSSGNRFGDVLVADVASISGYVWDDNGAGGGTAGDGQRNGSEPLLAGALVSSSSGMSQTTALNGEYLLYAPAGQTITVTEINPPGYVSSGAIAGDFALKLDNDRLEFSPMSAGATSSGNNFGDLLPADLSISKSDDPDPVAAGSEITYTVSYSNAGPSVARNVTITDDLGDNVAFSGVISQNPDIWTFDQTGQKLSWQTASVAEGQSGTIVFKVQVHPDAIGIVTNDVDISSDTYDPLQENNAHEEETTIGTPDIATIFGHVFDDLNGDGVQGDNEAGIANVLLTLKDGTTTHSDANGLYFFLITVPGIQQIEESDPDGYFSTTPNRVLFNLSLGRSYRVNFGDAEEADASFASIIGTVFEDANGNGERDDDELGIPGAIVTLDDTASVSTNLYGTYTISTTVAGAHKVVESDPAGYFSTTTNDVRLLVEFGKHYQVDFGDAQITSNFANVAGTVFDDSNGNGEREDDEPGLPGVTVTLNGSISMTTDVFGRYSFLIDVAGVYTIEEQDLPGYFSTTPNLVRTRITLGNHQQIDFGDAAEESLFASINGTVFEDINSNGIWDLDEVGLKGITVTLNGATTTTTDMFGSYSLRSSLVGSNRVEETDPPYYFSTTPNSVMVQVALGNGYQVDFGDVLADVATCLPDQYEEDDLYSQAGVLLPGVSQAHDFCDDAVDWYRFTVKAGNLYTITTSSWAQRADTFAAIYQSNGQEFILGNDDYSGSSDFSSQIVWQPSRSGEYYLRVTNRVDLTGFHTGYDVELAEKRVYWLFMPLLFNGFPQQYVPDLKDPHQPAMASHSSLNPTGDLLGPTGIIKHSCGDDFEVDDTWTLANPILSGVPQLHSFDSDPVIWAADKDFVEVKLLYNQTITLTATSNTGTSVLFEIYNHNGVLLRSSGIDQLVYNPGFLAGTYYISMTPVSDEFGCADVTGYTVTAEFKPIYLNYMPVIAKQ